jgi:hypothetical protein
LPRQPREAAQIGPHALQLLHGFTAFFALIGELFTNNRVYAFTNYGGWYDLGFVMGASAAFGGGVPPLLVDA